MTQFVAIFCGLFLALGVLFLAVFSVAACIQSGRDAEAERLAPTSVNWDYLSDETEHDDG